MRQKSVKIASKMRQKCAEHLWGRTPFGRYRPQRSVSFGLSWVKFCNPADLLQESLGPFGPEVSESVLRLSPKTGGGGTLEDTLGTLRAPRARELSLSRKSQRFLRFLQLRCPSRTPEIARFPRQDKAMLHCDLRVRWKVASDLRFRAAISEPKTSSFCRISGDLAPSTRKSLAIAMVRFWCAQPERLL